MSFGRCSWEEVEKTIPLENRGVKVLTKCNRRQRGVVATQTILKVDKRPGKHINLQQRIGEERKVIPTPTIHTGLMVNLSAPGTTHK